MALLVWGTNYFSLFVSYRYMSNKTQLTEFPESKSDMPLFLWVLPLKKEKKYKLCTKISRYRQLNAWRMEITT